MPIEVYLTLLLVLTGQQALCEHRWKSLNHPNDLWEPKGLSKTLLTLHKTGPHPSQHLAYVCLTHGGKYQLYQICHKLSCVSSCISHQGDIAVFSCQHTGSSARQQVSDKITRRCGVHLPSRTGRSMATLCLVKTWFSVCIIL